MFELLSREILILTNALLLSVKQSKESQKSKKHKVFHYKVNQSTETNHVAETDFLVFHLSVSFSNLFLFSWKVSESS